MRGTGFSAVRRARDGKFMRGTRDNLERKSVCKRLSPPQAPLRTILCSTLPFLNAFPCVLEGKFGSGCWDGPEASVGRHARDGILDLPACAGRPARPAHVCAGRRYYDATRRFEMFFARVNLP